MARFTSFSTYNTPKQGGGGGDTIEALMRRQQALQEAQAQPMPAQIASPWQGASMVLERLNNARAMNYAAQDEKTGRAELAKAMAMPGDPTTGMPGSEAMATITARDPEMAQQLYLAGIAARQKANAMEKFQILTPEEVKAAGLTPDKQYQKSLTTGKIDPIGGGGINITNTPENKSGIKWGETKASKLGEALDVAANAGLSARANDAQLGQLEKLLPGMPVGADAKWADYLRSKWGISIEGADKLQAFNAIIDKLVPQQRLPGSGTMSDRDIEMFRNSLPSMLNDPRANQMIIQTLRGINAYNKQLGDIAVKAGAIADPDEARNFYYTEAAKLANPLEAFSTQEDTSTPPPSDTSGVPQGGDKSGTAAADPNTGITAADMSPEQVAASYKAASDAKAAGVPADRIRKTLKDAGLDPSKVGL